MYSEIAAIYAVLAILGLLMLFGLTLFGLGVYHTVTATRKRRDLKVGQPIVGFSLGICESEDEFREKLAQYRSQRGNYMA